MVAVYLTQNKMPTILVLTDPGEREGFLAAIKEIKGKEGGLSGCER